MRKTTGIYIIMSPTNRFYVGQSWNVNRRIQGYKKLHAKGQPALLNSLLKHGVEKHDFKILEEYDGSDQLELNKKENMWWNMFLLLGYESLNCREPNGSYGKLSEDAKRKISQAHKGRVAHNKGQKLTVEQLLKRPKTNIGKVCSEETKKKMSLANSGEKNASTKLTSKQVEEIRTMLSIGLTQVEIGKRFNISKMAVSNIKLGKSWNN